MLYHPQVNKVLPIGGPGYALTAREQAMILFKLTGQQANYLPVPVAIMDGLISIFDWLATKFPQLEVRGHMSKRGRPTCRRANASC